MKSHLMILLLLMLSGCQSAGSLLTGSAAVDENNPEAISEDNVLERSLDSLATQLFLLEKFDFHNKTLGVTTFVWADSLVTKDDNNPHKFLEYYLPDSLKVAFIQKGANVVEYQTSSALTIADHAAYFLSRDISELATDVYMDYVLVGSLLEMDGGVTVTAQVIDLKSKLIVAGAKEYIPTRAFHQRQNVIIKNDQIHRDGTRN